MRLHPSLTLSMGLCNLLHVYIAWSNHLLCVMSLFPFLLRQIVDLADRSGCDDVLMSVW